MSIEICAEEPFYTRLAELAWEHASETAKSAIVATVALQAQADTQLYDSIASKVRTAIVVKSTKQIAASEQVKAATKTAIDSAVDALTSDEVTKTAVEQVLKSNKQALSKRLAHHIRQEIAPDILSEQVRDCIRIGTANAVKEYISQAGVNTDVTQSLENACDMRQKGTFEIQQKPSTVQRQQCQLTHLADHVEAAIRGSA